MLSNDEKFYKFRYFTIFQYLFRNATIRSIIHIKKQYNSFKEWRESQTHNAISLFNAISAKTFVDNIKITFIGNNNYIGTLKSKSNKEKELFF